MTIGLRKGHTRGMAEDISRELVTWDARYETGIALIDRQHRGLIEICNELFRGCLLGPPEAEAYFRQALKKAVVYVRQHFAAEEELMQRYGYPGYPGHKVQHEDFIRKVLAEAQAFERGESFVPNRFARFLRDWTLEHIAVTDHQYKDFFAARNVK